MFVDVEAVKSFVIDFEISAILTIVALFLFIYRKRIYNWLKSYNVNRKIKKYMSK